MEKTPVGENNPGILSLICSHKSDLDCGICLHVPQDENAEFVLSGVAP